MSRQTVNLLSAIPQKVIDYTAGIFILQYIGIYFILLFIATLYVIVGNYTIKKNIALLDSQIQPVSFQLETAEQQPDFIKMTRLVDETTLIDKKIALKKAVLNLLSNKTALNTEGFSPLLTGFSEAIMDNIWLTKILIEKNGKAIQLTGKTTSSDLISKYVDHLEKIKSFSTMKFTIETITKSMDDRAEFVIKGAPKV